MNNAVSARYKAVPSRRLQQFVAAHAGSGNAMLRQHAGDFVHMLVGPAQDGDIAPGAAGAGLQLFYLIMQLRVKASSDRPQTAGTAITRDIPE